MNQEELKKFIGETYFPQMYARQSTMRKNKQRFVHYTNAEAAFKIIKNKEIWLRQSTCMNDISEIDHGIDCVRKAFSHHDKTFKSSLDSIFPGSSLSIEGIIENIFQRIKEDPYLLCISEHLDSEDSHGRLSMWRAYGGHSGVAIVMKQDPFFRETNDVKAYTFPVEYSDADDCLKIFHEISDNIIKNSEVIQNLGQPFFINMIISIIRYSIVRMKHKGFEEEKEWRIVYSHGLEFSQVLKQDTIVLNGIPQEIYKLPLVNNSELGITGFELNEVIDRIIIGPCQNPKPIYKAFINILSAAGVENFEGKVIISDIPFRG